MAVLIVSAGNLTRPGGFSWQKRLFWAANDSALWYLYANAASNTIIQAQRSPTGATWTAKTSSPAMTNSLITTSVGGDGLSAAYKNISANDVVHVDFDGSTSATGGTGAHDHIRATISGGVISWDATWATVGTTHAALSNPTPLSVTGTVFDSTNLPVITTSLTNEANGDPTVARATNADVGTSWTAGWGTQFVQESTLTGSVGGAIAFDTGGGNLLMLWENANSATYNISMTNVRSSKWTGSWSAPGNVFASNLGTGVDPSNFGAVDSQTTSIVHCVIGDGTSAFTHRKFAFAGTTWAAGDTIPAQTYDGNNIHLATDGTNVWMFITNLGAIRYIKWTSGVGWDGAWTLLESPTGTLAGMAGWPYVVSNTIHLCFSKVNGTNSDLYYTSLTLAGPATINFDEESSMYYFRRIW